MVFGKRLGPLSGNSTASGAAAPQPEFAGARPVTPGFIAFGNEAAAVSAADRIQRYLSNAYPGAQQGQVETMLSAAGALAGFAAQQAIWEGLVRPGKLTPTQAFTRVGTKSGQAFFFGDLLNRILVSTEHGELSIWRIVAAIAQKSGSDLLPPLTPVFAYCAETVGSEAFDAPMRPGSRLSERPTRALRHWSQVKSILVTAGIQPVHWPLEIAAATQKLIEGSISVVEPDMAALIVMEAAIPMSRIDPRTVPGGTIVE